MECPFCAGEVTDDVFVCKHCARDLRVPESLLEESRELKNKVEELRARIAEAQRELQALRSRTYAQRFIRRRSHE
jgi:hypothetical protein